MSALDKKYDEPEEKKPVIYTQEEVTQKLQSLGRNFISIVVMLSAIIIAMVISFVRLSSVQTVKVVHPNATDSLRTEVATIDSTLGYFIAHTDTTGVGDMRERVGNLNTLVESLHGRYDQLQIEFNRHDINVPHQK